MRIDFDEDSDIGFNSLLEMRDDGEDFNPPNVDEFQFSIGDAAVIGFYLALKEGVLFQFSIGDARIKSAARSRPTSRSSSFNSLLEMLAGLWRCTG